MLRKFLILVVLVFAGLFVAGAQSGWQRVHSTNALVTASLSNVRVLSYKPRRYVIALTCPDAPSRPVYWQYVENDSYELKPTNDQVEAFKQAAKRNADKVGRLLANDFVVAGITGASASKIIDNRLGAMRNTLMLSRAKAVIRQRNAIIAGLIIGAGSGYYLGDWVFGNWPPRCGSDAGLGVFESRANRQMLRQLVFRNDNGLIAKIDAQLVRLNAAPSASDNIIAGTVLMQSANASLSQVHTSRIKATLAAEVERVNQVNREILNNIDQEFMMLSADPRDREFDQIRERCGDLSRKIQDQVCTYLQPYQA